WRFPAAGKRKVDACAAPGCRYPVALVYNIIYALRLFRTAPARMSVCHFFALCNSRRELGRQAEANLSYAMRTALILEYDGSRFCGWQSQPSGDSVQDAVEAALSKIACSPIRVVA